MRTLIRAALLSVALAGPALAQDSGIHVDGAWSRATPPSPSSAVVYFTVTDDGAPDTLLGASTPVAKNAQLHNSGSSHGMMMMRPVSELALSKDKPIKLAPGGYHLMLTGLQQQLQEGQTFPVTLTFRNAGAVTAIVKVAKAGARAPAMDDMGGMDMK